MRPPRRFWMFFRSFPVSRLAIVFSVASLLASAGQSEDPSQWSDMDVYRILHDSPWTKAVKVNRSEKGTPDSLGSSGAPNPPIGNSGNPSSTPGRMGGMGGRRGMSGGSYSSTSTKSSSGNSTANLPSSEVKVQWQSALPVRLATAKDAGQTQDAAPLKPSDEYVVAVIGLPLSDFAGRAASADSEATIDQDRVQNALKGATSLLRSGHDPLTPTKVELDQGKDGRILFHFPKTDPIELKDKTVEFRIAMPHAGVRKKFTLKEMEYQGQLQL